MLHCTILNIVTPLTLCHKVLLYYLTCINNTTAIFDGRTKLILSILNRENPSIAAFNIINNYLLFNTKQCVLSIILTIIIHNIKIYKFVDRKLHYKNQILIKPLSKSPV
jgi:hypothetical protein